MDLVPEAEDLAIATIVFTQKGMWSRKLEIFENSRVQRCMWFGFLEQPIMKNKIPLWVLSLASNVRSFLRNVYANMGLRMFIILLQSPWIGGIYTRIHLPLKLIQSLKSEPLLFEFSVVICKMNARKYSYKDNGTHDAIKGII
jgi:hypothetical protein